MPEFYMIIARKIFFPIFRGHPPAPSSPTPMVLDGLYVDVTQMTVRRRVSAVHLAGSSIQTCTLLAVGKTGRRPHSSNVSIYAPPAPTVLRLIGVADAGYMTCIVHVVGDLTSRSLRSLDAVQPQVCDVSTMIFYTIFMFEYITG